MNANEQKALADAAVEFARAKDAMAKTPLKIREANTIGPWKAAKSHLEKAESAFWILAYRAAEDGSL